jgi:hypothetical protein
MEVNMKKIIFTVFVMLAVSLTSISLYAKGNGKVIAVKGKVYIMKYRRAYKKVQLTKGQLIYPNDIILTSKNGIVRIALADRSQVTIRQNSRVKFSLVSSKSQRIKVGKGGLLAKVSKLRGKKGFNVNTPHGVAGVRGTKFSVEYDEDVKKNDVDVYHGTVDYSRDGRVSRSTISLGKGKAASDSKRGGIRLRKSDPKTLKKYESLFDESGDNISIWELND